MSPGAPVLETAPAQTESSTGTPAKGTVTRAARADLTEGAPTKSALAKDDRVTGGLGAGEGKPLMDGLPRPRDCTAVLGAHGLRLLKEQVARSPGKNATFAPEGLRSVFETLFWGASARARKRIGAYYVGGSRVGGNRRFAPAACAWAPRDGLEWRIANFAFLRQGLHLQPPIIASAKARPGSWQTGEIPRAGFAAWLAGINERITRLTNGLIEGDLDIPPGSAFALVNVMYLKALWSVPFLKAETTPLPFLLGSGEQVVVPTMLSGERELLVAQDHGFVRILLPYGDGDHTMQVIMPLEGANPAHWIDSVDPDWLQVRRSTAVSGLDGFEWPDRQIEGFLYLPRFDVAGDLDIGKAMRRAGFSDLFKDDRAFPNLASAPLALDEIDQKVRVIVNEEGTEAAAVTRVMMRMTSVGPPTPVFRIDRPFLFSITQASTGALLFLGVIANPADG